MRRLLILTAVLLAVPAASARAALFPGDAIDGPSPDIQALGDVDLARDGTGALAYVKRVGGVDAVFVARFAGGVFAPAERIDAGLPGPSAQPVVAAADRGRLVVVFVNAGTVYGVVRPAGSGFIAPVALGAGSDPSVDGSINGTAYASFTSGGDVRLARLDRRTNAWGALAQPADVVAAQEAGVGDGRSRVSVAADGVGVVAWGEGGHVYARKVFGMRISDFPQDLSPPTFEGRAATVSDLPDIEAEDDSSYAWVVFRQAFADGGSRILARRQRGTTFEPPVPVSAPDGEPVGEPDIDLNGRGVGLATTFGAASGQPMAALLELDVFGAGTRLFGPSAIAPATIAAMSENDDGLVAGVLGAPGERPYVGVRLYDARKPVLDQNLSRAELGPVDPARGFDAAADRAGGGVVAWAQGGPDDRRIVAGYLDQPPGFFSGSTSTRCCQPALARLSWAPALDLWGPVRYQVLVDGRPLGQTTATSLQLAVPLAAGTHRWQVAAIDVRGQARPSSSRILRIDALAPRLSVRVRRRGRIVTVTARARDRGIARRSAAGLRDVVVSWGNRARVARATSRLVARHRYGRAGTYTLRVTARDRAGNTRVVRRTVRVR
jgi:hypothetical protein